MVNFSPEANELGPSCDGIRLVGDGVFIVASGYHSPALLHKDDNRAITTDGRPAQWTLRQTPTGRLASSVAGALYY